MVKIACVILRYGAPITHVLRTYYPVTHLLRTYYALITHLLPYYAPVTRLLRAYYALHVLRRCYEGCYAGVTEVTKGVTQVLRKLRRCYGSVTQVLRRLRRCYGVLFFVTQVLTEVRNDV